MFGGLRLDFHIKWTQCPCFKVHGFQASVWGFGFSSVVGGCLGFGMHGFWVQVSRFERFKVFSLCFAFGESRGCCG